MLRRGGFLVTLLDPFNNARTEIVVDRSNSLNLESRRTVQMAPLIFSSFPARNKDQALIDLSVGFIDCRYFKAIISSRALTHGPANSCFT